MENGVKANLEAGKRKLEAMRKRKAEAKEPGGGSRSVSPHGRSSDSPHCEHPADEADEEGSEQPPSSSPQSVESSEKMQELRTRNIESVEHNVALLRGKLRAKAQEAERSGREVECMAERVRQLEQGVRAATESEDTAHEAHMRQMATAKVDMLVLTQDVLRSEAREADAKVRSLEVSAAAEREEEHAVVSAMKERLLSSEAAVAAEREGPAGGEQMAENLEEALRRTEARYEEELVAAQRRLEETAAAAERECQVAVASEADAKKQQARALTRAAALGSLVKELEEEGEAMNLQAEELLQALESRSAALQAAEERADVAEQRQAQKLAEALLEAKAAADCELEAVQAASAQREAEQAARLEVRMLELRHAGALLEPEDEGAATPVLNTAAAATRPPLVVGPRVIAGREVQVERLRQLMQSPAPGATPAGAGEATPRERLARQLGRRRAALAEAKQVALRLEEQGGGREPCSPDIARPSVLFTPPGGFSAPLKEGELHGSPGSVGGAGEPQLEALLARLAEASCGLSSEPMTELAAGLQSVDSSAKAAWLEEQLAEQVEQEMEQRAAKVAAVATPMRARLSKQRSAGLRWLAAAARSRSQREQMEHGAVAAELQRVSEDLAAAEQRAAGYKEALGVAREDARGYREALRARGEGGAGGADGVLGGEAASATQETCSSGGGAPASGGVDPQAAGPEATQSPGGRSSEEVEAEVGAVLQRMHALGEALEAAREAAAQVSQELQGVEDTQSRVEGELQREMAVSTAMQAEMETEEAGAARLGERLRCHVAVEMDAATAQLGELRSEARQLAPAGGAHVDDDDKRRRQSEEVAAALARAEHEVYSAWEGAENLRREMAGAEAGAEAHRRELEALRVSALAPRDTLREVESRVAEMSAQAAAAEVLVESTEQELVTARGEAHRLTNELARILKRLERENKQPNMVQEREPRKLKEADAGAEHSTAVAGAKALQSILEGLSGDVGDKLQGLQAKLTEAFVTAEAGKKGISNIQVLGERMARAGEAGQQALREQLMQSEETLRGQAAHIQELQASEAERQQAMQAMRRDCASRERAARDRLAGAQDAVRRSDERRAALAAQVERSERVMRSQAKRMRALEAGQAIKAKLIEEIEVEGYCKEQLIEGMEAETKWREAELEQLRSDTLEGQAEQAVLMENAARLEQELVGITGKLQAAE
eukprot:gene537-928_t